MALRYWPNGSLDNASAVEDILSRYEDDIHKAQEIGGWLHHLINVAAPMDGDYSIEEALWPNDDTHHCTPICEGGCEGGCRQTVATCKVTFPALGGASIVL